MRKKYKNDLDRRKANENSKYWKTKLWAVVREKVLERDNNCCVMCKSTQKTNVHHIIDKRYRPFCYETNNLICLCPKCHKFDSFCSAHCNPAKFLLFLKDFRKEQWKWIIEHCLDPIPPTESTYKELMEEIKRD